MREVISGLDVYFRTLNIDFLFDFHMQNMLLLVAFMSYDIIFLRLRLSIEDLATNNG